MMNMAVPQNKMSRYLMSASDAELDNLAQTAGTPDVVSAVDQEMQRRRRAGRPLPRGGQPMGGNQPPSLQEIATGGWTPPWQQMAGPALPPGTSGPDRALPPDGPLPKGGEPMDEQQPYTPPPPLPPTMPLTAPNSMEASAADEVTGAREGDTGPDSIHPALMETAKALDQPPSALQAIIDQITGGGQSDSSIRSNAIAKAGFAMAASRNPYFFGALGEGGTAGLEDYEKAKQEQLMNRVRGVGLGQQQEQQGETKRSNVAREGQEGQRIQVLQQQAQLANQEFVEKKRQFDAGFATDQELKRAEIRARNAATAYSQAAAGAVGRRGGQYFTDADGNTYYTEGASAQPLLDQNGKPVKGASKVGANGGTAVQRNAKYYGNLLFNGDEAAGARYLATGKTMAPDRRRAAAMQAAQAELNGDLTVLPGTAEYATKLQQRTQEIENDLATAGSAAAPIGANAAPVGPGAGAVYKTPADVKAAYKAGTISKEDAVKKINELTGQ
jgi:hypothetical protein